MTPLSNLCNTGGPSPCGVSTPPITHHGLPATPQSQELSLPHHLPRCTGCSLSLQGFFPSNTHSFSRAQLECHHLCDFSPPVPVRLYSTTDYIASNCECISLFSTRPRAAGKTGQSRLLCGPERSLNAACVVRRVAGKPMES